MKFRKGKILIIAGLVALASCGSKDKKDAAPAETQQTEERQQSQDQSDKKDPVKPITPSTTQLKYPVVFHQGFMNGEKQENSDLIKAVQKYGVVKIHHTKVASANAIASRAQELATQIDDILQQTKAEKVNILAHSIGGLDARYLISTLGYADKVASLSTVGTPHRGTPIADLIVDGQIPEFLQSNFGSIKDFIQSTIDSVTEFAGKYFNAASSLDNFDVIAAMENITEEYMEEEFNPSNPDADSVYYQSWAGTSGIGTGHKIKPVLYTTGAYLTLKAGRNDGVVPESSAQWGKYKGILKADHIDLSSREIGVLGGDGFEFEKFLDLVVKDLVAKGY